VFPFFAPPFHFVVFLVPSFFSFLRTRQIKLDSEKPDVPASFQQQSISFSFHRPFLRSIPWVAALSENFGENSFNRQNISAGSWKQMK
jgi:hypothetical protein